MTERYNHSPPKGDLESPAVLKSLISAHRHLAELKGVAKELR